MALVITILARKGGVGRTTTCLNLSGVWAQEGLRVLLVDLDSQASLSRCLLGAESVESAHPSETVAGIFDERFEIEPEEVIRPTAFENLAIVPACDALEDFNTTKPWTSGDRQWALKSFFAEAAGLFDVALIDTGPNTCGLSAWAALASSKFLFSPVLCDSFGTQSIISVQRLVERVQTSINPDLEILGYLINMRQKNTVMESYEQTLRKVHGRMILKTVLPLAAAYRQAVAERQPLPMKKGNTKAMKILVDLAAELNRRMSNLMKHKDKEAA